MNHDIWNRVLRLSPGYLSEMSLYSTDRHFVSMMDMHIDLARDIWKDVPKDRPLVLIISVPLMIILALSGVYAFNGDETGYAITEAIASLYALISAIVVSSVTLINHIKRKSVQYKSRSAVDENANVPLSARFVSEFDRIRRNIHLSKAWKKLSDDEKPDLRVLRDDFYRQASHLHDKIGEHKRRVDDRQRAEWGEDIAELFPDEVDSLIGMLSSLQSFYDKLVDSPDTLPPSIDTQAWMELDQKTEYLNARNSIANDLLRDPQYAIEDINKGSDQLDSLDHRRIHHEHDSGEFPD